MTKRLKITKRNFTKLIKPGVGIMKCFNYKIYDNDQLILKNSINAKSKEEALALLREDHDGATIKIIEVTPASQWKC